MVFVPRTRGVSTTALLAAKTTTTSSSSSPTVDVLASSLSGPLLSVGASIIKCLLVGHSEIGTTKNVYGIGYNDRNWKRVDALHENPYYPGTNTNREISVLMYLQPFQFHWNPVTNVRRSYVNKASRPHQGGMRDERRDPAEIWVVESRHAGQTLKEWWPIADQSRRDGVLRQIEHILMQLNWMQIIHGDVHATNLLVDHYDRVSLIDFGWVMWRPFAMDEEEQSVYVAALQSDFDRRHFWESMVYDGLCKEIPSDLK